jgi:hypothetical protein
MSPRPCYWMRSRTPAAIRGRGFPPQAIRAGIERISRCEDERHAPTNLGGNSAPALGRPEGSFGAGVLTRIGRLVTSPSRDSRRIAA